MKTRITLAAVAAMFFGSAAIVATAHAATVENVRAQQRPRSNIVEVFYDLVAPEGGVYDVSLVISGGGDEPLLSTLSGDWGADIIPGRNKRIEWDAGTDWAQHVQSNFVATVTATRTDEDTGPSRGMARIPGGTNSGNNPKPIYSSYSLTVESFYMDKTEVTYAHWKRVYNWAIAHGYSFDHAGSGKGDNHPVQMVNWLDCVKWCNARSEMEGRTPAYRTGGSVCRTGWSSPDVDLDGNGYRLPTTTEWEYAARGGLRGRIFPWGDTISHARANYYGSSSDYSYDMSSGYHPRYNDGVYPYTAPVASFAHTGYGLYDMVGNVSEWTTTTMPSVITLRERMVRGGSFTTLGDNRYCRLQSAIGIDYEFASDALGFRCVRRR